MRFPFPQDNQAIVRHLLLDADAGVRHAALAAALAYRDSQILQRVLAALVGRNPRLRSAALDALDGLGDRQAVGALIRLLESGGGPGVRASLSVTRQVSYVSDFDVEVASAA